MTWRFRLALCVVFFAGFAALYPMSRVPAGDLLPPTQHCEGDVVTCSHKVPYMLVNSRKIRLNYNISDIGPSGVSYVELWATRDGKNWQHYSNEPPPAGPLCVHVAEEGKYGFSLVVKNGVGLSSPVPHEGDAPQIWVEVDESVPVVSVTQCVIGNGRNAGTLTICWTATDANIGDKPVNLCTAVSKEGPWTTIASGLENTGKYTWTLPAEVPYGFYVKVEASDRAGNVGSEHTPRPIKIDMTRPKGTITGLDSEVKVEAKVETRIETKIEPGVKLEATAVLPGIEIDVKAPVPPQVFEYVPKPRR